MTTMRQTATLVPCARGLLLVLKIHALEFLVVAAAAAAAYNLGWGGLKRAFAITRANRPILGFDSLVSGTTISCTRRQILTNHGRPSVRSAHSRVSRRYVWGRLERGLLMICGLLRGPKLKREMGKLVTRELILRRHTRK